MRGITELFVVWQTTLIEKINTMKACKGSRRRALLILNLGTIRGQRSTAGPVNLEHQ